MTIALKGFHVHCNYRCTQTDNDIFNFELRMFDMLKADYLEICIQITGKLKNSDFASKEMLSPPLELKNNAC